jgi:ATP-binding cassette subfamily F protein uup
MSFKEARELAELPERIAALEREQTNISEKLGDAALYRDEPQQVKPLQERLAALEVELQESFERWENLEARSASPSPLPARGARER